MSLSQSRTPTCLKSATFVPVPKKPNPACMKDSPTWSSHSDSPEMLEWLVMQHIKSRFPDNLDPLQFSYRTNRSTQNAISTSL